MEKHFRVDVKQATKALREKFKDVKSPSFNRAVAVAINETMTQGRTTLKEEIRGKYNIKAGYLTNRALKINRASANRMTATLVVDNSPIPLAEFKAREKKEAVASKIEYRMVYNKRERTARIVARKARGVTRAGGVQVEIQKGQPKWMRGFFMFGANGKYGRSVVHRAKPSGRSSYKDGEFQYRYKRVGKTKSDTPVGSAFTVSPFTAATTKTVQKRVEDKLSSKYEERLKRTLERLYNLPPKSLG